MTAKLSEASHKAEVTGREKKPYAIWRKMEPTRDEIAVKGLAFLEKTA